MSTEIRVSHVLGGTPAPPNKAKGDKYTLWEKRMVKKSSRRHAIQKAQNYEQTISKLDGSGDTSEWEAQFKHGPHVYTGQFIASQGKTWDVWGSVPKKRRFFLLLRLCTGCKDFFWSVSPVTSFSTNLTLYFKSSRDLKEKKSRFSGT